MFEFTLSKINMLIFVTAIAVVVIFFMNTLNDNLKTRQSYETAYKIGKEVKSLIDSDSYCSIKFIDIPKTIRINEGSAMAYKLGFQNYTLYDQSSLIIYITDIKEKKILGAYNLDYNGTIVYHTSEYNSPNYIYSIDNDPDKIFFNPRKVNGNESKIMLINNIKNNELTYHVIPCEKKLNVYSCKRFVCGDDPYNYLDIDDIKCLKDFCTTQIT
jgi:hypothetical protein